MVLLETSLDISSLARKAVPYIRQGITALGLIAAIGFLYFQREQFFFSLTASNVWLLAVAMVFTKAALSYVFWVLLPRFGGTASIKTSLDITLLPDLLKYFGSGAFSHASKLAMLNNEVKRPYRMFLVENAALIVVSFLFGCVLCLFSYGAVFAGIALIAVWVLVQFIGSRRVLKMSKEAITSMWLATTGLVIANIALGFTMLAVFPGMENIGLVFGAFAIARVFSYISIVLPAGLFVREAVMYFFLQPYLEFDEIIAALIVYRILVAACELGITSIWLAGSRLRAFL